MSSKNMIVRPAPGIKVRDPATGLHLSEDGLEVPKSDTYWQRRIRSGDVLWSPVPEAPAKKAKEG